MHQKKCFLFYLPPLAMFAFDDLETKTQFFSSEIYREAKLLFLESTTHFAKLIE
ncbi:MAG: hypothetical protein GXO96_10265 [Nitrospirae bacterium]|nr:hypothetical protein [Candidatus Manganitrophaceae bacterium]